MTASEVAFVLLEMAGRRCAIPCEHVLEIIPAVKLTSLPDAPEAVLGVLNLRGEVVPVVDVRARLGERELAAYQHVVIVRAGDRLVGLAADEVLDVQRVAEPAIRRPGDLTGGGGPGIAQLGGEMVVILDPRSVLDAEAV